MRGCTGIDVVGGDVVAIPSWCPTRIVADSTLDAFVFSDAPVYEALKLYRATTEQWGEVT